MNDYSDIVPRLRNVEPFQAMVEGQAVIGLKDPLQLVNGVVCLRRETIPVLALLDGAHSVRDIQAELTRMTGQLVHAEDILGLIQALDQACLLESDRYRDALAEKVRAYRALSHRPASHAGISYAADAAELKGALEGFFSGPDGPGMPSLGSDARRVTGLVAPHIDIRSGGASFAHAYHALAAGQPSDVYVIFGTGHSGVHGLFTTTGLDFETPLGLVKTDKDFLTALEERFGEDLGAEEILHATEHVIEFQAVFLQYALGHVHPFTIVPILVSLAPAMFDGNPLVQEQRDRFARFCRAMRETCLAVDKTVCFIASADLDHVGPRYGDQFSPSEAAAHAALDRDRETIAFLENVDVEGFIKDVAKDNESRRICGFSPITAMLHCMEATAGEMLDLRFTRVDDRGSFVSFVSLVFY